MGTDRKALYQVEDEIAHAHTGYDEARAAWCAAVRTDAAYLWEAFAPFLDRVVQSRLAVAFARRRQAEASVVMPRGHTKPASAPMRASGQEHSASHLKGAARPQHRVYDFHAGKEALVVLKTVLDQYQTPFGRAVGDITGAEARSWVTHSRRDLKVATYVASHTPADGKVRDYVKAEDLEAVVRAADRENDHAT
jgi:hypothetical protein